jgi:hypothetical protein
MSRHWSVCKEEDKRLRVREVEAGLQMTQSAKETMMTQRQQIYQEEKECRLVDLHEKNGELGAQQKKDTYSCYKLEVFDKMQVLTLLALLVQKYKY